MDINPQILTGHWKAGFALDLHTLSSVPKEYAKKIVEEKNPTTGEIVKVEKDIKGIFPKCTRSDCQR